MPRVKYLSVKKANWYNLSAYPNFSATGSIKGMKDMYYGKNALLVKSGQWIYNVSASPEIYEAAE